VTPGQLKSRLETLKRLSIKDEAQDEGEDAVDEAGAGGDVEHVGAVCPPNAAPMRPKRRSKVIPMCCTIN